MLKDISSEVSYAYKDSWNVVWRQTPYTEVLYLHRRLPALRAKDKFDQREVLASFHAEKADAEAVLASWKREYESSALSEPEPPKRSHYKNLRRGGKG